MSGGHWGYQQWRIQEQAEDAVRLIRAFGEAIAQSEHIIDWQISGDTIRRDPVDGHGAERDLYDLWLKTFEEVYG